MIRKEMGQAGINLHITLADIDHQSRIRKETKSILAMGLADEILIAAVRYNNQPVKQQLESGQRVILFGLFCSRLPSNSLFNLLKYLEFFIRLIVRLRNYRITSVNCHNVFLLPFGAYFKRFKRSRLIYDAHELETERTAYGKLTIKMAKWIERKYMDSVDELIVVSPSIRDWYKTTYHLTNVHLLRNIPSVAFQPFGYSLFREKYNLPQESILFIYQGLLNKGRSIQLLLDVFAELSDKSKYIVFMGYGPEEEIIKRYTAIHNNILYHPPVHPDEIIKYTSGADAGISLIENNCLSYYYSLPNKFFEYLRAGIPVLASDFPDMGGLIDEYDCGWKVPVTEQAIREFIINLSPEEINRKKAKVNACKELFSWENEQKVLPEVYGAK